MILASVWLPVTIAILGAVCTYFAKKTWTKRYASAVIVLWLVLGVVQSLVSLRAAAQARLRQRLASPAHLSELLKWQHESQELNLKRQSDALLVRYAEYVRDMDRTAALDAIAKDAYNELRRFEKHEVMLQYASPDPKHQDLYGWLLNWQEQPSQSGGADRIVPVIREALDRDIVPKGAAYTGLQLILKSADRISESILHQAARFLKLEKADRLFDEVTRVAPEIDKSLLKEYDSAYREATEFRWSDIAKELASFRL